MFHIPNLRPSAQAAKSLGYIDTLFDYGAFLRGGRDCIGEIPAQVAREPIAVVGAGIGGLVAAYELLRAGARDVTLFEASPRPGGRAYSRPFSATHPECLAELGTMRSSPGAFGWFHYLEAFGIAHAPNLPDPVKVLLRLIANELEPEQEMVLGGIESLIKAFCDQRFDGRRLYDRIHLATAVSGVSRAAERKPLVSLSHGRAQPFSRVIVAASHQSLSIDMGSGSVPGLLTASQRSVPSQVHELDLPGTDELSRQLFYQFLSCKDPATDPCVYLAGDSPSFTGGWIEGAVQTGVNAACAVIRSLDGSLYTPDNPIDAACPERP